MADALAARDGEILAQRGRLENLRWLLAELDETFEAEVAALRRTLDEREDLASARNCAH